MKHLAVLIAVLMTLSARAGKAVNAVPVSEFDAARFVGTWYEIARLDHVFERGLTNVSAQYSQNADDTISVVNRGFNGNVGKYQSAKGEARVVRDETTGQLEVSFFGPFFANSIVFGLNKFEYSYAFVSGGSGRYLWLLSRTTSVSPAVRADFIT